jgi:hypothetical protein
VKKLTLAPYNNYPGKLYNQDAEQRRYSRYPENYRNRNNSKYKNKINQYNILLKMAYETW